ncbi:MAG: heme-binding protein [Actinobacteria bacterium]|nr:heme-binding protein [Actinomycetota bacterium]
MNYTDARTLIDRAIDKAAQIGARGAFAVVGSDGAVVSASRMDGDEAGGMARARSKAWISATQQIPSTVHHDRVWKLPPPIGVGFVACSPEANFPGAGAMPLRDGSGEIVAGFSASGCSIGPFVDLPGIDRRHLIAEGKPANAEDLIVQWALGLDYEGQHGDDANRWQETFGELPTEAGLGYSDAPAAAQPRHLQAVDLVDRIVAEAHRRDVRVAVTVCDRGGDPVQQDAMPGSNTAASIVAEAVARSAARFELPSDEVRADLAALLPIPGATAPGGLPIRAAALAGAVGVGGPAPELCREIAGAVLG